MHSRLPAGVQACTLLRPRAINIWHAQRVPGSELLPRDECAVQLTCARECAGRPGYWAVIFFQQLASVGNNLAVQIVAGQCMKVHGLHWYDEQCVVAVYVILDCCARLTALMVACTCC